MRLQGNKTRGGWLGAFTLLALCLAAAAQEPAAGDPLVVEQATVSERFREAERRLLEMAQGLKESDPARAAHLAEVVARARREFVADGMSRIARLLEQERYTEAIELEEQVLDDLAALVDALSARQWTEDLERLTGLGRRLDDLVERQRRAEENLARAGESEDLAAALQEQEAIHRDTTELLGELDHAVEGSSAAAGQLRSASRAMEAAMRELEANRGKTALPHEENARRALEAARRAVRDAAATVVAERQRELLGRLIATLRETLARQEVGEAIVTVADAFRLSAAAVVLPVSVDPVNESLSYPLPERLD